MARWRGPCGAASGGKGAAAGVPLGSSWWLHASCHLLLPRVCMCMWCGAWLCSCIACCHLQRVMLAAPLPSHTAVLK